jgi:ABC-type bacteriocin/lantibiotic exporter with double-glycine peptidase domain
VVALFKGTIMTSFINTKYATEHTGADRVESAMHAAGQLRQGFSGTRGLAALLLSAIVSSIMVVAYQVTDSVAEGHLLVIWMALWAVAFAGLALFAGTARNLAARTTAAMDAWSQTLAQARADIRMWEAAQSDPRVMSDLRVAMARQEVASDETAAAATTEASVPAAAAGLTQRAVRLGGPELRAYHRYYV